MRPDRSEAVDYDVGRSWARAHGVVFRPGHPPQRVVGLKVFGQPQPGPKGLRAPPRHADDAAAAPPNLVSQYRPAAPGLSAGGHEVCRGETLTQVIRASAGRMLDWRHAFKVALHIGRALDFAAGTTCPPQHPPATSWSALRGRLSWATDAAKPWRTLPRS